MAERRSRRRSEWRRLFRIALDLIDQLHAHAGGYDFQWSVGGGTAMMILLMAFGMVQSAHVHRPR